jgi:CRP/FNR family transcriptional regulator, cyclic AMP receptor protein
VELHFSRELDDLSPLVAAVRRNRIGDPHRLTEATWQALSGVLLRQVAAPQTCLIREGDSERHLYFVESGLLRVFRADTPDRMQLGVIGAGSLAGEGAFFSPVVRAASVETIQASAVWDMPREAFELMAQQQPQHALALALYLGTVLSARMLSPAGRMSIT